MAKMFECDDGVVLRGDDDDELLANVELHVVEAHPDLVGKLSREEILATAKGRETPTEAWPIAAPSVEDRRTEEFRWQR
jgi:hypothetical protein